MPTNEQQALIPHSKKLPVPVKMGIEMSAAVYGHITGLLAWRCITIVTPLPKETATDLVITFASSLLASSGIINLCRHHLYDMAERIQESDDNKLSAIWHELSGGSSMETAARILALTLKIIGGIAEGCISYAAVKQVLEEAPENFATPFAMICGIIACLAFPLVEGSSLSAILSARIDCRINDTMISQLKFHQPSLLKRIFYPDDAILAAVNNQYGEYHFSRSRLIATNLLTNLGVLGIGLLALTDSAELLSKVMNREQALAVAIPLAFLYFAADTALHAIPTKLSLYGLSLENPIQLLRHNPILGIMTLLQSLAISLIPLIALNSTYWFFKEERGDYELSSSPLFLLITSGLLGVSRVPLSFCGEGLSLMAVLHEENTHPLFNWLSNLLQFTATSASILFQLRTERFDLAVTLETYAIAGGINLTCSALRHGFLSACIDRPHQRIWNHSYSPLLRLFSDFIIPALFGLTTQLVCLYLILPKETDNSKLQHSISCLIGGLVAGLSAIFWRFISNKTQLFYRSQDTLTETRHATVPMSRKISDFFSSCVCSSIVENEVEKENLDGVVTPIA